MVTKLNLNVIFYLFNTDTEAITFFFPLFLLTGYKLAFNYLKGKRYVDAITICHKVQFVLNALSAVITFVLRNDPSFVISVIFLILLSLTVYRILNLLYPELSVHLVNKRWSSWLAYVKACSSGSAFSFCGCCLVNPYRAVGEDNTCIGRTVRKYFCLCGANLSRCRIIELQF